MPRISVSLSEAEHDQFRVASAEVRLPMAVVARGLIIEWMKEGEDEAASSARAAAAAERVSTG